MSGEAGDASTQAKEVFGDDAISTGTDQLNTANDIVNSAIASDFNINTLIVNSATTAVDNAISAETDVKNKDVLTEADVASKVTTDVEDMISTASHPISQAVTVASDVASSTSEIVLKNIEQPSVVVPNSKTIEQASDSAAKAQTTIVPTAKSLRTTPDSDDESDSDKDGNSNENNNNNNNNIINNISNNNSNSNSNSSSNNSSNNTSNINIPIAISVSDIDVNITPTINVEVLESIPKSSSIKKGIKSKEVHAWQSQSLLANGSWGYNSKQLAPHFVESLSNSESENFPDVRSTIGWQWMNEWSIDKSLSSACICQYGECDADGWMYAPTFDQLNKTILNRNTTGNAGQGTTLNQRRKRRWIRKLIYDADNVDIYWFAKEIRSITVRNLSVTDVVGQQGQGMAAISRCLPSSSLEVHLAGPTYSSDSKVAGGEEPFGGSAAFQAKSSLSDKTFLFSTGVVANTCNPTWVIQEHFFRTLPQIAANGNIREFVLVIKDANKKTTDRAQPQLRVKIDITNLVFLKNFDISKLSTLPLNTILFIGEDDGVYMTETLYKSMLLAGLFPAQWKGGDAPQKESSRMLLTLDEYNIENRQALVGFVETIKDSTIRTDELKMELEKLRRVESVKDISTSVTLKEMELKLLKQQLALEEAMLEEELRSEKADVVELASFGDIRNDLEACEELEKANRQVESAINGYRSDLIKAQFLLEARQLRLIYELQHIYPIETAVESGERTIRGVELPFDLRSKDEEVVATALGYVVHLLLLTSKYLDVPLRYTLIWGGSRSFIKDPVYNSGNTILPLFKKGNEQEKFERAIQWLRKNVEQLLQSKGLPYDSGRDILFNVKQFFECKLCNSLAL